MAYTTMKKLIQNENIKFENGTVTEEEYKIWRTGTEKKLDTFLSLDRISISQYEELFGMLLRFPDETNN